MLNLFDYLTEKDNKIIENFITTFGVQEGYIGNKEYLSYWADNNKKLFRLLGGQLIFKTPFEYTINPQQLNILLSNLKKGHSFTELFNIFVYGDIGEPRESSLFYKMLKSEKISDEDIWDLGYQLNTPLIITHLSENQANVNIKFKRPTKRNTLRIDEKMKSMKAIRAILLYFDVDVNCPELYNSFMDFQKKYSIILNTKKVNCNMCFSIHPMDFLTMSDNDNNWTSCMSWKEQGCYHAGTVEMMNSNCVICVYLDSSTPFIFDNSKEDVENYTWNNKKWRQLFYCTKEIIVSGKPYPYPQKAFTLFALQTLRELAETNWNQTYQFGIEPYRDMIHVGSYYRMENNRQWIRRRTAFKYNILFDTNGMYNDMFNDANTIYWCIRNKVPHSIMINYSGKAPCACCMNDVLTFNDPYIYDDDSYNDRYTDSSKILCPSCIKDRRCEICGNDYGRYKILNIDGKSVCTDCIQRYYKICPDCGEVFYQNGNDYDRSDCVYVLFQDDKEIKHTRYFIYPSTDIEDRDIAYDAENKPVSMVYHCCKKCKQKMLNNNKIEYREIDYGFCNNHAYTVAILKGIHNLDDPDIIAHKVENLKSADIKKD